MQNLRVTTVDACSLTEGTVFHDHYEVVRRIDSGAMGAVYEVTDARTKRRRALKVMLARFVDNPDVTERFRREATITADVHSEHVVETFDAGVDDATGLPFLVMELLRGEDLGKIVLRGPVPQSEVVVLLMQAASALDKMHKAGIIHRDLKPENLFVTRRDDGAPRLKVLDFGIAKVVEKSAPSATSTRNMGTPVYMSPEQVIGAGDVSPSADLYALGQLAYTMLVGQPYWLEDALAFETVYPLLLRIMEGAAEPASERALRNKGVKLPAAFDAWFAKATAKAPEDRFKTASESILALSSALDVPRPAMPSWLLEQEVANTPTLAPPADAEEEPIPLIASSPRSGRRAPAPPGEPGGASPAPGAAQPAPPERPEATRTLSPVAARPGSLRAPAPEQPRRRRYGLVIGLGAAFFVAGVGAVLVLARGSSSGDVPGVTAGVASSEPTAASALPTAASAAAAPTIAPSIVEPVPDPSPSAEPTSDPDPVAPSASSSARAVPTVKKQASKHPRVPPSSSSSNKKPYVDPGRDL